MVFRLLQAPALVYFCLEGANVSFDVIWKDFAPRQAKSDARVRKLDSWPSPNHAFQDAPDHCPLRIFNNETVVG